MVADSVSENASPKLSPGLDAGADSYGSKIGREAGAITGGVVDGLFAAAHNIKERPMTTAVQAVEGVAVAALLNKVAILKFPAMAVAAYGGTEMAVGAIDFANKALPAVAQIWDNPHASDAVKTGLQSQISKVTAAGTVSLGTMFVAGKGLQLLEKDAPNNALGRYVFGHEPVSFKYPRYQYKGGIASDPARDIELKPFTQRELDRLVTVEKRDYTYQGKDPGPFYSSEEARLLGQRQFTEASRIYKIAGADTQVVVPESLERQIDRVRQLERALSFPLNLLNGGRNKTLRAELGEHPLAHLAKPEDILTQLATLPDPNLLKTVVLSPYPMSRFKTNVVRPPKEGAAPVEIKPNLTTGMAASADETTYLLHDAQSPVGAASQRSLAPGHILRHEWAHFAHFGSPEFKDAISSAAFIERNGFYLRKYATKNIFENNAVHMGEGLIDPKGRIFRDVSDQAPLRSAVMGRRLGQILDNVPEADRGLYHGLYTARMERLEKLTTRRAKNILGYIGEGRAADGTTVGLKKDIVSKYLDLDAPPKN